MPFCPFCSAELQAEAQFCSKCGKPVASTNIAPQGFEDPQALFARGNKSAKEQDYTAALKYYDAALQKDPHNYKIWHNKGIVLKRRGDSSNAEYCMKRAEELKQPVLTLMEEDDPEPQKNPVRSAVSSKAPPYEPNYLFFLTPLIWAVVTIGLGSFDPFTASSIGALVFLVSCTVLVFFDARKIGAGAEKTELSNLNTWKPWEWGALTLLLWIIGYPLYLLNRRGIYETKNQLPRTSHHITHAALLIGVILFSVILVGTALVVQSNALSAYGPGSYSVSPYQSSPITSNQNPSVSNDAVKRFDNPDSISERQPSTPTQVEAVIGETVTSQTEQITIFSAQKTPKYTWSYSSSYKFTENANPGNIFVIIDAEIKNIGSDSMYITMAKFSMSDSEGNRYDPELYAGDDRLSILKELYTNQKTRGKVVFQVPENARKLKLYYDFGNILTGTKLASWSIN